MTKHDKTKANVSNGSFAKYAERKKMYSTTSFRIKCDGTTCYVVGGVEMPESQFKSLFPVGLIDRSRYSTRADPRQRIIY